jgi:hypothetical protein
LIIVERRTLDGYMHPVFEQFLSAGDVAGLGE